MKLNTYHFTSNSNETSSPGTPNTHIESTNLNDDSSIDIELPSDMPEGRKSEKVHLKRKI